jgi:hypothetical protein
VSHAQQLHDAGSFAELCNYAVQLERDAMAKLRERCARLKRQRDWLRLNQFTVAAAQPGSKPPASVRSLRSP